MGVEVGAVCCHDLVPYRDEVVAATVFGRSGIVEHDDAARRQQGQGVDQVGAGVLGFVAAVYKNVFVAYLRYRSSAGTASRESPRT